VTASSLGPAYTTVWHRDPYRHWTFFSDVDPRRSCPRFFGRALDEVVVGEIELIWDGPFELSLRIPESRFHWGVRLSSDLRTQSMSALGRVAPATLWKNERILSMVGSNGGRLLGLGNLARSGSSPNRQRYRVEATAAIVDREDLGEMAPLPEQARLGDFWIPNAGIFAIGETRFESFDPEVHSSAITRPRSPVSLLVDSETEGKTQ
jgi:hypothetical protein